MIFLRVFDRLLRVLGGILAVLMGALSALLEAVYTPWLWFVPAIAAVLMNLFLYWFTRETVGTTWSWSLAAIPWFIVMIAAVAPTSEGDQLANSIPGLLTFGAGALTFFAVIAFRPLPPRRPRTFAQPPLPARENQPL